MTLKTILAAKGSEVVSIDFTADLAAAAKLLTKHRIGALMVLGAGGRLAGICGCASGGDAESFYSSDIGPILAPDSLFLLST